jgi:hypothetical protein
MLLERIEEYMRITKSSPTKVGREAIGDPQLVFQLRDGREPRARTIRRVLAYLEQAGGASR